MKSAFRLIILVSLGVAWGPRAGAQFYAPDTEYHDMAQRVFPVEMARVLAWRANASGKAIAEVTYNVATHEGGKTAWQIDWLDGQKNKAASIEVVYGPEALLAGPGFYRQIAKQMLALPGLASAAGKKMTAEALGERFWAGADMAVPSRMDCIARAFGRDAPGDPAGLAGLLAEAALPSMAGAMTLDGLLLARASAWLCIAESGCEGAPRDDTWGPILFLAGREKESQECQIPSLAKVASPSRELWVLLATQPLARDCYLFAADPVRRECAHGALLYAAQMTAGGKAFSEAIGTLFGADRDALMGFHDYGPFLAKNGGIGGGRMLEGLWPMISRKAWIAGLRAIKSGTGDYAGHAEALARAGAAWPEEGMDDGSLVGLAECAPLLKLGLTEAKGPLIPVAIATVRDLLGFGWEMTGCQMAGRYSFVDRHWGVHDLAATIAKQTFAQDLQLGAFFIQWPPNFFKGDAALWDQERNHLEDFVRMQSIDDAVAWMGARDVFASNRPEQVALFAKRCWLRPHALWEQSSAFCYSGDAGEMLPHIRRSIGEGGRRMAFDALFWLVEGLRNPDPESTALQLEIAKGMKEPTNLQIEATQSERASLSRFELAQEEEKIFWMRPGADLPYARVFADYIWAGAFESAKRFYNQAESLIDDTVGFSNTMGQRRIALALAENDRAGLAVLLNQRRSGSYADMVSDIVAAAAQNDLKGVAQGVDEAIERYRSTSSDSQFHRLKRFLPLIPALKDPGHPRHAEALDYFARDKEWPALQWFLIKNLALSKEDAIRFLGTNAPGSPRGLMISYLRGDKDAFERGYASIDEGDRRGDASFGAMACTLLSVLRKDLLKTPEPQPRPDLRPLDAKNLVQILREKAAEAKRAALTTELGKIGNADALWAHFTQLRTGMGKGQGNPRELFEKIHAVAREFATRYPDDPRKWEARLWSARLAQFGAADREEGADFAVVEGDLREIADAKAASAEVRGDAQLMLFGMHLSQAAEASASLQPLRAELDRFAQAYPNHRQLGLARLGLARALGASDPEGARSLIRLVASGPDPAAAKAAGTMEKILDLTRKPIEMKFTAIDGRKVDLAALRGKVVLIDFWATWCAPCMARVGEMIELDRKHRAQGLVIIGISLDQKKQALEETLRNKGIGWPQYFDGRGFENEISSAYGIDGIPRLWLVNKRGLVVNTQAESSDDLASEIEKLLSE